MLWIEVCGLKDVGGVRYQIVKIVNSSSGREKVAAADHLVERLLEEFPNVV
jgi:ribosomal protein S12